MTSQRPVLIQNKKMMGWGVAATFGRAMVLPLVKQTIMNSEVTIIGIAGGTGSGKTTVVKKIVEALPPHYVAVVPLDSYYNENKGMSDEERHAINFDHPDAFDWKLLISHVNELRHGRAVEQPTYSYIICNRLPETIHVEPKKVIIKIGRAHV